MAHPLYGRADAWTSKVIGAAIEVHRHKGPGLLESIYQKCALRELDLLGIPVEWQVAVPIEYKGLSLTSCSDSICWSTSALWLS